MTQAERVLKYMIDFGGITTLQAFQDLGCSRLSARIYDLKHKKGIAIKDERCTATNRYGGQVMFKKYYLADEV